MTSCDVGLDPHSTLKTLVVHKHATMTLTTASKQGCCRIGHRPKGKALSETCELVSVTTRNLGAPG